MKLVFTDAEFADQVCQLGNGTASVGRGPDNRLVIQHNSVSLHHCELMVYGSEVIVHDLGSANGTYVDGARVTGQHEVKDGQLLRIGSVTARLVCPGRVGDEPSEVTAVHLHVAAIRQAQHPAPPVAPARTIIRPRTGDDDANATTNVSAIRPLETTAEFLPAAPAAAPAGKSRLAFFLFAGLVVAIVLYIIWRAR